MINTSRDLTSKYKYNEAISELLRAKDLDFDLEFRIEILELIAKNYEVEFVLPSKGYKAIEDGNSFLKNAYCKANCARKNAKTELFLADDSGLCIEALKGAPGIYSARYAQTAQDRINRVLEELKGIDNRKAKFVCAMVLVNKKGEIVFQVQKECHGTILEEQRGKNGFGYDPIFYLPEYRCYCAELSDEEKNRISHRGKALEAMKEVIRGELGL